MKLSLAYLPLVVILELWTKAQHITLSIYLACIIELAITTLACDLPPSQKHGPASLPLKLASHGFSRSPPRCHYDTQIIWALRITMLHHLISLGCGIPSGSHPFIWLEVP